MFPCNIGGHAAYQDFGLTEIFHFYPDPLCWNVIPNMGLLQEFLPACFVPACYPLNLRLLLLPAESLYSRKILCTLYLAVSPLAMLPVLVPFILSSVGF